jgi:hypothetical protein
MHRVIILLVCLLLTACGGGQAAAPAVNVQATVDAAVKAALAAQTTNPPPPTAAPTDTPAPPTEAAPAGPPATPTVTIKTSGCKIKEVCTSGGVVLIVGDVPQRTERISQIITPPAGRDYAIIYVSVAHAGRAQGVDYNPLYFKLRDDTGGEWPASAFPIQIPGLNVPSLSHGKITTPGDYVAGMVAFELPKDAKPASVIFTPSAFGVSPIRVDFGQ